MIDAQSIVVAATARGETGHEGGLVSRVFGHSIRLALLLGTIFWDYAHFLAKIAVSSRITAG
jgi:L-lactate permease